MTFCSVGDLAYIHPALMLGGVTMGLFAVIATAILISLSIAIAFHLSRKRTRRINARKRTQWINLSPR